MSRSHVHVLDERGASVIEFALVLPLLVMILFGIYQFGVAYNSFLAVSHAAREGARLAAVGAYDQAEVAARAYPVTPTAITLEYPSGNSHGNPARVTVAYDLPVDLPFLGRQVIPIAGVAQMRLEK